MGFFFFYQIASAADLKRSHVGGSRTPGQFPDTLGPDPIHRSDS